MNGAGAVVLPARPRRLEVGPQRENTLGRVAHPDPLRLGPLVLERIDDPLVSPLQDGYSPLGWEGDERMCLYADRRNSRFVLVRLEHDGVYRIEKTTTAAAGTVGVVDLVARLIADIVREDHRRGHDPYKAVAAVNDKVRRDAGLVAHDRLMEAAGGLRWALKKDLGAHA